MQMITQYLLDKKGQRIGVLTAVLREDGRIGIGFSKNRKTVNHPDFGFADRGDIFDTSRGRTIAHDRAMFGTKVPIPASFSRKTAMITIAPTDVSSRHYRVEKNLIDVFVDRCRRYFKVYDFAHFTACVSTGGSQLLAEYDGYKWHCMNWHLQPLGVYTTLQEVFDNRHSMLY